jgi:hypothetical protein
VREEQTDRRTEGAEANVVDRRDARGAQLFRRDRDQIEAASSQRASKRCARPASPRQPAWTIATPPGPAIAIGRQSATCTATAVPQAVVTTPSAVCGPTE